MSVSRTTAAVRPDDEMLGVHEVQQMLGVGESWVYKTFALEVPPARIAGKLKWPRWKVLAFIEESTIGGGR